MNHRPDRRLIDAEPECDGSDHDPCFVRHPSLLIGPSFRGLHLAVVSEGGKAFSRQKLDCGRYPRDRRNIDDDTPVLVAAQRLHQ